jgi:hypothetical protein
MQQLRLRRRRMRVLLLLPARLKPRRLPALLSKQLNSNDCPCAPA